MLPSGIVAVACQQSGAPKFSWIRFMVSPNVLARSLRLASSWVVKTSNVDWFPDHMTSSSIHCPDSPFAMARFGAALAGDVVLVPVLAPWLTNAAPSIDVRKFHVPLPACYPYLSTIDSEYAL